LNERLELSRFRQRGTAAPADDKAPKRDPVLKEETRHKIERPTESLRLNGLYAVTVTLRGNGHKDTPDGHGEQGERKLNYCRRQREERTAPIAARLGSRIYSRSNTRMLLGLL
jgi:hypothetical protein